MSVGSAVDTEYSRQSVVIADSYGRIMELYDRGVYGDGPNDATSGVFHAGYPDEESSDYKTGTISTRPSGTNTSTSSNKLIDSTASFATWVVGCAVYNMSTGEAAVITARDSGTTLSLGDQGDGADIFPDTGDTYAIFTASGVIFAGTTYSYLVDTTAVWTPEYGKGTSYNYLSLRGLWAQIVGTDGTIQRKQIISNEDNKLWFLGGYDTTPSAGDTYYVAGIYWEMDTGYIYPENGHSLSLEAMRSRVVSSAGPSYWFQLSGSGTDQTKDSAELTKSVTKHIRNQPKIEFAGKRHQFVQVKNFGVVQDDQIVIRSQELAFRNHAR